jgi:hypothetical protein
MSKHRRDDRASATAREQPKLTTRNRHKSFGSRNLLQHFFWNLPVALGEIRKRTCETNRCLRPTKKVHRVESPKRRSQMLTADTANEPM